jgi:HlyD family secretion protein
MSENAGTPPPTPESARAEIESPHAGKSRRPIIAALTFLLVGAIALAAWSIDRSRKAAMAGANASASAAASVAAGAPGAALRVEVATPRRGGLGRTVVQPGVVHAFNKAGLYAKVSGYLIRQRVDIGDMVKKGDLLTEINVPELFKGADQARAALGQAQARQKQAEARLLTARADRESAAAHVQQAESDVARYTAERIFRKKQLERITELARRKAVAEELVDEGQKQYEAAIAAERASGAEVAMARAMLSAADARIAQAQADLEGAKADVDAAAADLAKAEILLEYTRITAPFDGVITLRSFHEGDFIRSASEGGAIPVLSIAQNDLMRVIILVPDRDVPFVARGDPARIQVDALQGRTFEGKVARFANAEDEQKLMRTEVDLRNPDNLLKDGMYGTATLILAAPSKNLTIPSSSLIEQDSQGHGAVYIVRDGTIHRVPVLVGLDNGRDVEILQGLKPDDQVAVRYNGPIAEGVTVQAVPISG